MCATLAAEVFEFTRPMYSSMIFGLLPAAWIRVGCGMRVGMVWRPAGGAPNKSTTVVLGPNLNETNDRIHSENAEDGSRITDKDTASPVSEEFPE